jgi:chemotaxis protein methyltransferase CheR
VSATTARARRSLAQQLALLLERTSGIATPEQQFDALLQKAAVLVPHGMSFDAYVHRLAADTTLLAQFIEGMCTHETRFFRHAEHFDAVEQLWVPARRAKTDRRRVRAWSVACSTGEEPFSLAMLLSDHFPSAAGWCVEVLGTDLSSQVLARAQAATWPIARSGEIGPARLDRYLLRGRDGQLGRMRARPELRAVVRFKQLNLIEPPYAIGEDFDLVFLRNVLIYFSAQTKRRVLGAVLSLMAPGALLVTGPSEGVSYLEDPRLRSIAPHVFVHAD